MGFRYSGQGYGLTETNAIAASISGIYSTFFVSSLLIAHRLYRKRYDLLVTHPSPLSFYYETIIDFVARPSSTSVSCDSRL